MKKEKAHYGKIAITHATVIEKGKHFLHCIVYTNMNMVRAGVVDYPRYWVHGCDVEVQSTRRKFKDQSIANLGGVEDGSIFDGFPSQWRPLPIPFSDHGPVAWIPEFGLDVVADEIEKGRDPGIADSLGAGSVSCGMGRT